MIPALKRALRPTFYRSVVSTALFERYIGWRRSQLKLGYIASFSNVVMAGPFAGMRLQPDYSELPKFVGSYEASLHPYLSRLMERPYDLALNIGCAEGYYAVGLARAMPRLRVRAFDTDPVQRIRCLENAKLNGVADRIVVAGQFDGVMFNDFAGQRVLVVCDIEGAEIELLQPGKWGGLAAMDLLVELHEDKHDDIRGLFEQRFSETHQVNYVPRQLVTDLAPIEKLFSREMDQLTAIYENRFGPTSWIVLLKT